MNCLIAGVILTTRPIGAQWPKYEEIILPILSLKESYIAINDSNKELIEKISEGLRNNKRINCKFLRLIDANTELVELRNISCEQIAEFYRPFLDKFQFSLKVGKDTGPASMPFLSTYRDLDNAKELFIDATLGNISINTDSFYEAQRQLFHQFLLKRVEHNYKNRKICANTVLERLFKLCKEQLIKRPQITRFEFTKEYFKEPFDGTTYDKVALESELLVEKDGYLIFDNDLIDKFFIDCAKRDGKIRVNSPFSILFRN